jgi:hypothetical protein
MNIFISTSNNNDKCMQRLWRIGYGNINPQEKICNEKSAIDIDYKGIINRKTKVKNE